MSIIDPVVDFLDAAGEGHVAAGVREMSSCSRKDYSPCAVGPNHFFTTK